MKTKTTIAAILSLVGLAAGGALGFACDDLKEVGQSFDGGGGPIVDGSGLEDVASADAAQLSGESDVLHAAITVSLSAVELGQFAEARATQASVQAFATQVVTEYGLAARRQQELATRLEITPTTNAVSAHLEGETDAVLAELQGATGEAFDRAYVAGQAAMLERSLAALDGTLVPAADRTELRTELTGMRDAVAAHLAEARELLETLPSEPDGGDGDGGDGG